jgi:hypothetical protein
VIALRYLGGGWLMGVPARDLTAEEADKHGGAGYLIESGLYEPVAVEEADGDNDEEE